MTDTPDTGLRCECCKEPLTRNQVMSDGFTVCCGANLVDADGNVVIQPDLSRKLS